jgi:hypothetical protein
MDCVELWIKGDRSDPLIVQAKSAFMIALCECDRLSETTYKEEQSGAPGFPGVQEPLRCSQAELAEALGYRPGFTRLLEHLKNQGIVDRYERLSKNGMYLVWMKDASQHAELATKLSGKPRRRARRIE